ITLHADFVHAPETMEEMVKRLESGADLVVAEQSQTMGAHWPERWARQWAPRLLRVGGGIKDSISGFIALRLIVLRQATRGGDKAALLTTEGWAANAELLARLGAFARRVELVPSAARYDRRQRPSRTKAWQQLIDAWRSRGSISAARKSALVVALVLLAAGGGAIRPLASQDTCTGVITSSASSSASSTTMRPVIHIAPAVTFPVGERLTYS